MKVVRQASFGTLTMDFYMDGDKEVWATRKQIGLALGYANPQNAIDKINLKHVSRFEGKSVTAKLEGTDRKIYDTTLYNSKGIMEICRWARTKQSDEFYDWVTDIIDELRINGVVVSETASYEQVTFNVDLFIANLDRYEVHKLYGFIEEFLNYHRENKTRLPYKRASKQRHGNKKYKDHVQSMEEIRDYIVSFINTKITQFNKNEQSGLAHEFIRIREMVRVGVENMRYRTAACKK